MKRYETGNDVPCGLYITMRPPDVRFVSADGETLDGRPGARYRRAPSWVVLLLAPVLGGAFVMAFPFVILAAIAFAIGSAITGAITKKHAYVARVGWEPAAAYLKKDGAAGAEADASDPELEALSREARARAAEERHEG